MAENILVVMNKEDLQPLANDIKTLNGLSQSDLVTLDEMEKAIEDANDAVDSQKNLIAQISAALEGKAAGGGAPADPILQEKTVSPSTSQQSVTPDSGYDGLSKVTVNAMATATQATPSISVSSAGLITASSTQTAGYVAAGTKSATKQLTTQAAQTITPGTSNKTIASGRYLTGTQTIKGDANLKAANIAKGVSIFGINGTHEGGEDISSETTTYTNLLDDLEDAINSLPGAGGGSGTVETCTVSTTTGITMSSGAYYSTGSQVVAEDLTLATKNSSITVAKNSILLIETSSASAAMYMTVSGNGELIRRYGLYILYGVYGDCSIAYNPVGEGPT